MRLKLRRDLLCPARTSAAEVADLIGLQLPLCGFIVSSRRLIPAAAGTDARNSREVRNGGNRIAAAASAYGKEAVVERQQRILALFSLSENRPATYLRSHRAWLTEARQLHLQAPRIYALAAEDPSGPFNYFVSRDGPSQSLRPTLKNLPYSSSLREDVIQCITMYCYSAEPDTAVAEIF